jgi:uncharacterized protein (DUF2141 family)
LNHADSETAVHDLFIIFADVGGCFVASIIDMMKNRVVVLVFFFLIPFSAISQLTLTVEISGLRNNKGQVLLELTNDKEVRVSALVQTIDNNKCVFVISNLKHGKYALRFVHDENKNGQLDTNWCGIPKEGFGFSNNPAITIGPPAFAKTIFDLKKSTTLRCTPKYFF